MTVARWASVVLVMFLACGCSLTIGVEGPGRVDFSGQYSGSCPPRCELEGRREWDLVAVPDDGAEFIGWVSGPGGAVCEDAASANCTTNKNEASGNSVTARFRTRTDCATPATVVEEGQPLQVASLPVITLGASGTTCGTLETGGAQEQNDETTMKGQLGVALMRLNDDATLDMSLGYSGDARGEAPDLDFFLAETTIADPWFVPSAEYLARFNGTDNPEVGVYSAVAQDYLLVVHNYVDVPSAWSLDIEATAP